MAVGSGTPPSVPPEEQIQAWLDCCLVLVACSWQGLKRHRAEMAAAQASMVAQLRAQAAAAAANGGPGPGGAAGAPGGAGDPGAAAAAGGAFLPPGMQLPPGIDPAQLGMMADGWA